MDEYIKKEKLFDCLDIKNALGGHYGISLTAINAIPAADVVPVRHGRWEYEQFTVMYGNPYGCYRCSACGDASPHISNYCPNCGAKMTEDYHEQKE